MIHSNHLRIAILAAFAGLASVPAVADDVALQKQVETLRAAIDAQRAQLEAQAKLLEAQQAQLEALTRQMQQPGVAAEAPKQEAPKMAVQEAPKVTFANNGRPSRRPMAVRRLRSVPTCSSMARCTVNLLPVR
jgi:hypothetical protein